jgi:hypothetical protein
VTDHDIQFAVMLINSITFVALIWYCWETRRLRIIAQDQLEALSKPCLTIWADLRNQADAILSMNQAVGNTVVRGDDGSFVALNIGNGPALNVKYIFRTLDAEGRKPRADPSYVPTLLPAQKVALPQPINAYTGNYEIVFEFESFSGRSYQSIVTLNGRVLVAFQFQPARGE